MKNLFRHFSLFLLIGSWQCDAAVITQAEYFIGTDPGIGQGTAITLTDTQSLGSALSQVSVSLSGRAPGTYTVGIRVKDDQNRWSNPSLRRFTLQPSAVVTQTTSLVQSNAGSSGQSSVQTVWSLGLGSFSGNQVSILAGDSTQVYSRLTGESNASFVRRIRGLMLGNPYITSRFTLGSVVADTFTLTAKSVGPSTEFSLSSQDAQVTRVTNGSIGANDKRIVAAEYFWNVDPGQGSGTAIPITTNGHDASFSTQSLPISNLSGGQHRLGIRFKNEAGRWSNPVYRGVSSFVLFGDQDTTAPAISLIGSSLITINQGATFNDPGITATDAVDGNITSKVVVTVGVDSSRVGLQTIEYTVADKAGNIARKQRQVQVNAITPNLDYNSNGMPDWWEDLHFNNLSGSSESDVDGDGTSNVLEYLAGTNPNSRSSAFRPVGSLSGVNYTMPISTITGRTYKVWVSRDLNQWVLRQTLTGDGTVKNFIFNQNTITSGPLYAPAEQSRYFFRVEVTEL
jgi:hypothetical protein